MSTPIFPTSATTPYYTSLGPSSVPGGFSSTPFTPGLPAYGFPSPGVDPSFLLSGPFSNGQQSPYSSGAVNTLLGLAGGTAVNVNFGQPYSGVPPFLMGAPYSSGSQPAILTA